MILFLHHRYRTTGGEERAVAAFRELVRRDLGEDETLLERDSSTFARTAAAVGLLRGGVAAGDVAEAVRTSGARVVHAHNLLPTFGWRALAAAQDAGARTVLHLHNYRLVCATGVCTIDGQRCTRCHGRNTLPGLRLRCRGSRMESVTYAAGLALSQRRLVAHADEIVVPSQFVADRLVELGAPVAGRRMRIIAHPVAVPAAREGAGRGAYAVVVSRLAPEKGVDVAIRACREAAVPLQIAGDGPLREALEQQAAGGDVQFLGRLDRPALDDVVSGAGVAIVSSYADETFGLAAAEAMAHGVPVVGSRVGALAELLEPDALVDLGDVSGFAAAIGAAMGDPQRGARGRARVQNIASLEHVAAALRDAYDGS